MGRDMENQAYWQKNKRISLFDIFNYQYLFLSICQKNYVANTFNYYVMLIFLNHTDG